MDTTVANVLFPFCSMAHTQSEQPTEKQEPADIGYKFTDIFIKSLYTTEIKLKEQQQHQHQQQTKSENDDI